MVTHKQIYKEGCFGGKLNTTLCGRVDNVNNKKNDGMNISDNGADFTCKLCIKISKTHWGKILIDNSYKL